MVVVEWVGLAPFIGLWSQRTVQKNKRKIKKNEGVSVHFLQAYHFWYEQGSREGCEWRASQLWDGMALSYDPCQRTNMTRCGAVQHLSLSGLYSGGSPLALRAETMGAVVGRAKRGPDG